MKYLFFDIECANSFDGVGKICEFGYVLTDENLNVIKQGIHLINPDAEFDWYVFYLNESPRGPKRYTHISQVWRQQDEYEEIAAYLEEHKKDWEDYAEWAIQSGIFSSEFAVSIL